jgi:cell wall-associated NlpC family hydrolase
LLKAVACAACALGGISVVSAPAADARTATNQVRGLIQQHLTLERSLQACMTNPATPGESVTTARRALAQARTRRARAVRLVASGRVAQARARVAASRNRVRSAVTRCRVQPFSAGGFDLPTSGRRAGGQPLPGMAALGAPAPASAPAPAGVGPLAARVIVAAKARLGSPYVFGTAGPRTFDCSGFIWDVFRQTGISFPRSSTYADWASGIGPAWSRGTDHAALKVGDIVYFRPSSRGPGHAGLYVGGGQIIHAGSGAGRVVRDSVVSGYYRTNFVGFLRHGSLG